MQTAGSKNEGVMAMVQRVREAEERWWHDVPSSHKRALEEQGLQPESMRVWGEILFLLLGLKPGVILTGLSSSEQVKDFVQKVFVESGLLRAHPEWKSGLVERDMETSYFNFKNSFVIYDDSREDAAPVARRLLDASSSSPPPPLSEKEIATLLDYPVHLKEGAELEEQQKRQASLVEVAYFVEERQGEKEEETRRLLVTSFGAEEAEIKPRVLPHFQRYREACGKVGQALVVGVSLP
ncbi:hypothetical protein QOT17_013008 [Balamuthia mandrillaris]